jgi:hypothetical protein
MCSFGYSLPGSCRKHERRKIWISQLLLGLNMMFEYVTQYNIMLPGIVEASSKTQKSPAREGEILTISLFSTHPPAAILNCAMSLVQCQLARFS